jgi:hypothetical protein
MVLIRFINNRIQVEYHLVKDMDIQQLDGEILLLCLVKKNKK